MKLEKGWTKSEYYNHLGNGGIHINIIRQEENEICAIEFTFTSNSGESSISTSFSKGSLGKLKDFLEKEYHKT